jgi:hypothetical protein
MVDMSPSLPLSGAARSRYRLPHWGWFLFTTVVLVIAGIGLSIWPRYQRECQVMQMVKSWGGTVETETGGPQWLRRLVGEDRVSDFKILEQVSAIFLPRTRITDADVIHLSGLQNLQRLILDGTAVTDAGLVHLREHANLKEFGLAHTHVTDASLSRLSGLTNLKNLDLRYTSVTDSGLAPLKNLRNLWQLSLLGTAITDAGLTHLSGMKNLRWLDLHRTAVTRSGREELRRALPDCNINF